MDKTEASDFENNNVQETYTNPQDRSREELPKSKEKPEKRDKETQRNTTALYKLNFRLDADLPTLTISTE